MDDKDKISNSETRKAIKNICSDIIEHAKKVTEIADKAYTEDGTFVGEEKDLGDLWHYIGEIHEFQMLLVYELEDGFGFNTMEYDNEQFRKAAQRY